ncbi:MAG: heme exporter protein CcmD [Pseudomonadota bacterium]
MAEYFALEGYGIYVWPSYGATALVLAGLIIWALRRNASVRAELVELEARNARRRKDAA